MDGFRAKRYGDGEVDGVALLDSPTSGGGEEGIAGNDGVMLGITKGSRSGVDFAGSLVAAVGSSLTSSSPNST